MSLMSSLVLAQGLSICFEHVYFDLSIICGKNRGCGQSIMRYSIFMQIINS